MMVCGRNEQAEIPLQVKRFACPLDNSTSRLIQWTFRWNQNELVFSFRLSPHCPIIAHTFNMMMNSVTIMNEMLKWT